MPRVRHDTNDESRISDSKATGHTGKARESSDLNQTHDEREYVSPARHVISVDFDRLVSTHRSDFDR